MKPLIRTLLALVLSLSLTGCVVRTAHPPYDPALVAQLMESEAFSEPLEPLDEDLVWILYDMDASGLRQTDLNSAAGCCSAGATCEQAVVMTFASEHSAMAAQDHLENYLSGQIEANRSYRPAEVPKLEKALLSRNRHTVLLVVAHNYDAAAKLIHE